jgi:hypothetical protein
MADYKAALQEVKDRLDLEAAQVCMEKLKYEAEKAKHEARKAKAEADYYERVVSVYEHANRFPEIKGIA